MPTSSAHPVESVLVAVPASTSNLGPGFDTLGIALNLHNRVRLTPGPFPPRAPHLTSPINPAARPAAQRLIADAARCFFRHTNQTPFGFEIHLDGEIPIARGLGSSVTLRLGVMAALDHLTGTGVSRDDLFSWVSHLEGHPDNAAPATYGGFTVSAVMGKQPRCVRLTVPRPFRFVALIPSFEISTEAARRLVPDSFSKEDTLHNLCRASLITAAFAVGDINALRGAFADRIHQPYRQRLIPELDRVIRAGEKAGALGGWLSGSGSTILCLTVEHPEAVAQAMAAVLPDSTTHILTADARGFQVMGHRSRKIRHSS